jgi:branched-chain amino acid transport system permease protein
VLSGLVAPIAKRGHLAQALLTFGVALMAGWGLSKAFGADQLPVTVPHSLDHAVSLFGHRYPGYRLAFIAVAAVLGGALSIVVRRTRVGSLVRATVDDREIVATLGVNPGAVRTWVLVAAGALAGAAGALGAPILGPAPDTADTVILLSLVVVVLGGMGSISGAFIAAIVVGEIQTVGVTVAPTVAPFALFAAMALALAARAGGLLPSGRHA